MTASVLAVCAGMSAQQLFVDLQQGYGQRSIYLQSKLAREQGAWDRGVWRVDAEWQRVAD